MKIGIAVADLGHELFVNELLSGHLFCERSPLALWRIRIRRILYLDQQGALLFLDQEVDQLHALRRLYALNVHPRHANRADEVELQVPFADRGGHAVAFLPSARPTSRS